MKSLLKLFIINFFSLWLATKIVTGFSYTGEWETLLEGAAALSLINIFVKPIVRLLLLPFNLLTFGVFSWLINAGMIYLLTKIIPKFQIVSWFFPGIIYQGFTIPSFNFEFLGTLILTSFIISLSSNFFAWLSS